MLALTRYPTRICSIQGKLLLIRRIQGKLLLISCCLFHCEMPVCENHVLTWCGYSTSTNNHFCSACSMPLTGIFEATDGNFAAFDNSRINIFSFPIFLTVCAHSSCSSAENSPSNPPGKPSSTLLATYEQAEGIIICLQCLGLKLGAALVQYKYPQAVLSHCSLSPASPACRWVTAPMCLAPLYTPTPVWNSTLNVSASRAVEPK